MANAPRYRLILVPVSGSRDNADAAAHAAAIAAMSGATVAILGVIDVSGGFAFDAAGAAAYEQRRAGAQAAIEAASAVLRGAGVRHVEHLIMDGTPHVAVIEVAGEQGADLIVTAGDAEIVMYLIRHAHCPVLVVPREGR